MIYLHIRFIQILIMYCLVNSLHANKSKLVFRPAIKDISKVITIWNLHLNCKYMFYKMQPKYQREDKKIYEFVPLCTIVYWIFDSFNCKEKNAFKICVLQAVIFYLVRIIKVCGLSEERLSIELQCYEIVDLNMSA